MKHTVSHDLGEEKARQVADAAFAAYSARFAEYKPQAVWVRPNKAEISFTVKGLSLKGVMEVSATAIDMDLDVPFLLRPFKGTALGVIEKEIQTWVAKAKSGQL
jgi:hypothetical protein